MAHSLLEIWWALRDLVKCVHLVSTCMPSACVVCLYMYCTFSLEWWISFIKWTGIRQYRLFYDWHLIVYSSLLIIWENIAVQRYDRTCNDAVISEVTGVRGESTGGISENIRSHIPLRLLLRADENRWVLPLCMLSLERPAEVNMYYMYICAMTWDFQHCDRLRWACAAFFKA